MRIYGIQCIRRHMKDIERIKEAFTDYKSYEMEAYNRLSTSEQMTRTGEDLIANGMDMNEICGLLEQAMEKIHDIKQRFMNS